MLLHAYSLYDRKALQYHVPFFAVADGSAVRSLEDLANDLNTTVGRHPGDYVLFRVGSFDDGAGVLQPLVPAQHVTDALALVRPTPATASGLFDRPGVVRPGPVEPAK